MGTKRRAPTLDDVARRLMHPRGEAPRARSPQALPPATKPASRLPKKTTLFVDESNELQLTPEHRQLRSLEIRSSPSAKQQARWVDFSPLAQLSHLSELLSYDSLIPRSFEFLSGLPKLKSLWCQPPAQVVDLTFLKHAQLQKVHLPFNFITSLETASAMPKLVELEVSSLSLKKAVLTQRLATLEVLSLGGDTLEVQATTEFTQLKHLFITAASLRSLDFVAACPNLETLGLFFSSPTRRIELRHLRRVAGRTRALQRADRDLLEQRKPGVLRLT